MLSGEEIETNVRTSTRELVIYLVFLTLLVTGLIFFLFRPRKIHCIEKNYAA